MTITSHCRFIKFEYPFLYCDIFIFNFIHKKFLKYDIDDIIFDPPIKWDIDGFSFYNFATKKLINKNKTENEFMLYKLGNYLLEKEDKQLYISLL